MKFTTTIFMMGNNTGIDVPPDIVEALGGGKRPSVNITVGSFSYRSTVAPMAGKFLIPLSAARRTEAGLAGGDVVEVDLTLDSAPRKVGIPQDLAAALAAEPATLSFFETLSYSNQLRHVLSVTDAKTAETRQRRIDKAMLALRAGRK